MKLLNKTVLVRGVTNKVTKSGIILATDKDANEKEVYIYYVVEAIAEDCVNDLAQGDKLIMFTPHHAQTWSDKLTDNKDLFLIYERDIMAIVKE